jgi:hypothetical protein
MTVTRAGKPITVDGYDTLEQYTKSRFGFDKSRRAQVLNLAQVFVDVDLNEKSTTGRLLTLTERSFRPMYRLDQEQRRTAWKEIEAVSDGEHIAPGTIAKTVNHLYPKPKKPVNEAFPSEELIDAWIGKFLSQYRKESWVDIAGDIERRVGIWRSEAEERREEKGHDGQIFCVSYSLSLCYAQINTCVTRNFEQNRKRNYADGSAQEFSKDEWFNATGRIRRDAQDGGATTAG